MTDPQTNSEFVTVNTPAGERRFKRLSPADWVRLGNTLRAARKAELRGELEERKATAEQTAAALDAFDRRPLRYADVHAFLNTLEGQYAAIMIALQRDAAAAGREELEAQFNALRLPPAQWVGVAAALFDLETEAVKPDPADPLAGAAGGEAQRPAATGT